VNVSAPAPTLWAEWGTVRYPIHLGAGLLPRIAENVDGMFLGRFAHDANAVRRILDEIDVDDT